MYTPEKRAAMSAVWLARWQGWQSSGVPMAEYSRGQGFDADAAYRWKRILRRNGQWVDSDAATGAVKIARIKRPKPTVRFARVAVSGLAGASMQLRVVLTNGRRAELDIGSVAHLGEVLAVLERAA